MMLVAFEHLKQHDLSLWALRSRKTDDQIGIGKSKMSQQGFTRAQKPSQSTISTSSVLLQQKCDKCRKKKPLLQRSAVGPALDNVPNVVHEALPSSWAQDTDKLALMEPRLGMTSARFRYTKKSQVDIQAKLAVNTPGDVFEQEADRVADQVLSAPVAPVVGALPCIQRFSGRSDQSEGKWWTAPASVDRVLASSGKPLEPALRHDMEQRFGHDFSRVRVHTGGAAEQSAREVNALAYTVGQDVVFGLGQYAPQSDTGRRLMAHELAHVMQQSHSIRLQPQLTMRQPVNASEREADVLSGKLVSHEGMSIPGINPTEVQVSRKESKGSNGPTLPYREATELAKCIRIMGDANTAYCRQTVLGEPSTVTIPSPSSGASTATGATKPGKGATSKSCQYSVIYANPKEVDCDTAWKAEKGKAPPEPVCGKRVVFEIVSVSASDSSCPLDGLMVSESVETVPGKGRCTKPGHKWPAPIPCKTGPGGKLKDCIDTLTLCYLKSDPALGNGGCEEVVEQHILLDGKPVEKHIITFEIDAPQYSDCRGKVSRK